MKIEELLDELKWDTHYPYHREIAAEILFLFSVLTKQVEELKKELQAWKDSRDGVIQEISDYTIKIADLTAKLEKAEKENEALKKRVEELLDSCRSCGIPCGNKECEFFDMLEGDGCGAENQGESAISSCKKYIPL